MSENFDSPIERNFCGAQVERPELPVLDVTEEDEDVGGQRLEKMRADYDALDPLVKQHCPQNRSYWEMTLHQAFNEIASYHRKLLSAQSRIRELEQQVSVEYRDEVREMWRQKYLGVEAERHQLKARILTITETPEWFDSPCARAVREVLEGK
jgi:hypothetical protein